MTTRISLDDSYLPDKDIELFLTDKFQEIKSSHPLQAYIAPEWPLPNVLTQLIKKASGQFIYASTVINYVSSIRHKPMDRLDIILGICPPQKELPFAQLDALYTHLLSSVEDVEHVLEILSFVLFGDCHLWFPNLPCIENILLLQRGDAALYFGDLSSIIELKQNTNTIRVLHASLTDFFVDPTRSKEFWINPRARHTVFARQCLQSLQLKGEEDCFFHNISILIYNKEYVKTTWLGFFCTVDHLENAEMTPELRDDLINFSIDNLQNVMKELHLQNADGSYSICYFCPHFLECLKKLVCHHLCSLVLCILTYAILQPSQSLKRVILLRLFKLTLTERSAIFWKNITLVQDFLCVWEASCSTGTQETHFPFFLGY